MAACLLSVCALSVCLSGSVVLSVSTHLHVSALAVCICFRHLCCLCSPFFVSVGKKEKKEKREKKEKHGAHGLLLVFLVCCLFAADLRTHT